MSSSSSSSSSDDALSIAETNRIRASLGLPPLISIEETQENKMQMNEQRRQLLKGEDEKRETEELRNELKKRKEQRFLDSSVSGPSLGDILLSNPNSFKINKSKKSQKGKKSSSTESESSSASLSIAHSAEDVASADGKIFTLSDQELLKKNLGEEVDLNESEETELVNAELAEKEATAKKNEDKRKAQRAKWFGSYDFLNDNSSLLSQYDDPNQNKQKVKLTADGRVDLNDLLMPDVSSNTGPSSSAVSVYSLSSSLPSETMSLNANQNADFKEAKFKKKKQATKEPAGGGNQIVENKKKGARRSPGKHGNDSSPQSSKLSSSSSSTSSSSSPSTVHSTIRHSSSDWSEDGLQRDPLDSRNVSSHDSSVKMEFDEEQAKRDRNYLRAKQKAEEETQRRKKLDAMKKNQNESEGSLLRQRESRFEDGEEDSGLFLPTKRVIKGASENEAALLRQILAQPVFSSDSSVKKENTEMGMDDNDDLELSSALQRARKLAAITQKKKVKREDQMQDEEDEESEDDDDFSSSDPIRRVAEQIRKQQRLEQETSSNSSLDSVKKEGIENAIDTRSGFLKTEDGIIFTNITEFCRTVAEDEEAEKPSRKNDVAVKTEGKEMKNENAMEVDDKKEEATIRVKQEGANVDEKKVKKEKEDIRMEDGQRENDSEDEDEGQSEDEAGDSSISFLHDEPLAGSSVADALSYSMRRGLGGRDAVSAFGRARDGKIDLEDMSRGRDGKMLGSEDLLRVNEFGRVLKPKEAYRELSHRYHRKMPGAKKREKELKRMREESRTRKVVESGGFSQKLTEAARKKGAAFVILDKNMRPTIQPAAQTPHNAKPANKKGEKRKQEQTANSTDSSASSSSASSSSSSSASASIADGGTENNGSEAKKMRSS